MIFEKERAVLSLFERWNPLDGLDTWQPREEELYRERGKKTAREGYVSMSREYLEQPVSSGS